ncbi:putative holin-like toxin [Enterococcus mundtii]|nr:putative holin-like toxin [Enterococcus mundtii]AUB53345.1 putative holin-like toxin [Enterococcus mundtii]MZZ59793.1 putative holin-like toxin [Enterococcus mundtii]MZZ62787.1 putative holin-like toxin [Enterococcus mundtii]MZZ69871.1 putative holin-like toxin [Enterococcus mundtii]MZZ98636.1 putative holin-like toxin [Enterococcus mundtii]
MTVATSKKVVVLIEISTEIEERRSLLSVETALGLMISFGSFTATLIFGILALTNKNDKKK